jgi:hypothetical protein
LGSNQRGRVEVRLAVLPHVKSKKSVSPPGSVTAGSSPNGTETDNYSTKGNVNPVIGKEGTKDPKK